MTIQLDNDMIPVEAAYNSDPAPPYQLVENQTYIFLSQ